MKIFLNKYITIIRILLSIMFLFLFISCSQANENYQNYIKNNPPKYEEVRFYYDDFDINNGKKKFISLTCSNCHSTEDNIIIGPGLRNIYKKGDNYILRSVLYPDEYILEGYKNLMPNIYKNENRKDIEDIIAYIKTFK